MYWYEKEGGGTSTVLSTRVRFARNLEKTPFPRTLSEEGRSEVFCRVQKAYEKKDMLVVPFDTASPVLKEAYVQTHLASKSLAKTGKGSGLLLSRDGEVSLMVNEEDHIRLQVIRKGKEIRSSFEKAVEWMRFGEEKLPIAFREKLGYLTACPTNLGGAMRVSVMIHLPALCAAGRMTTLTRSLNDLGFTVRGLFGEGSRESGNIFQISNQMSRDKTEEEIIASFEQVIVQVEEQEKSARELLLKKDRLFWEDRVSRAVGTLQFARKMSYSEFIGLYSLVRFGKEAGFPVSDALKNPDRLFVELSPAPLLLSDQTLTDETDRDAERSRRIRENMKHP